MRKEPKLSMPSDQVEMELPVLISDLHLMYRKYFNQQMREMNLTAAQWQVLSCLARNEGITQTEISDLLTIGKSPIGKTLDSLETAGWIRREASSKDRRVKNIYLSNKLANIDGKLMAALHEMNGVTEQGLEDESISQLRSCLAIMRENLRKALDPS